MPDDTFHLAYNAVVSRLGAEQFHKLEPKARSALIYQEMRRIDEERATDTKQSMDVQRRAPASGDM